MAATRLIPLHINKGKTAAASASCDDSPAGGWWINEASLASLCMCYIVF